MLETGACDASAERLAAQAASLAASRPWPVVAVSNEVGLGVVPASAIGRRYRDVLGRVNAGWAHRAERAALVVAGLTLTLKSPDWLTEEPRP